MNKPLATADREMNGPFTPVELKIVDLCLPHIRLPQHHGLLYDSVGFALCVKSDKTEDGPHSGHWFVMSDDAHQSEGRGAIIPFLFSGRQVEVHLPPAHAKDSYCWMFSEVGDSEFLSRAGFAFATTFVAKFWDLHQSAILNPRRLSAIS